MPELKRWGHWSVAATGWEHEFMPSDSNLNSCSIEINCKKLEIYNIV